MTPVIRRADRFIVLQRPEGRSIRKRSAYINVLVSICASMSTSTTGRHMS